MARQRQDPGDREAWVQSNTEFHQDWTHGNNQGHHVKWKQGVSLGSPEATRRYAPTSAHLGPRRWLIWLFLALVAIGGALYATGTAQRLVAEVMRSYGSRR